MTISVVLVVEDNKTEQYALKVLLNKFDYGTQLVSSGEEAILALDTAVYAAILMDLQLPGMDGLECTRRIRALQLQSGTRTPIIALTASNDRADLDRSLAAGMDDFLSKPFEPEDLRKVLLRCVYDAKQPNLKTLSPLSPEDDAVKLSA
jgi:CheY-like chemotaxis protein